MVIVPLPYSNLITINGKNSRNKFTIKAEKYVFSVTLPMRLETYRRRIQFRHLENI